MTDFFVSEPTSTTRSLATLVPVAFSIASSSGTVK